MNYNEYKVKPIPGYEDQYVASECGKVFDLKRDKEVYTWLHEINGYQSVLCQLAHPELGRKHKKVHQLIARAWLGTPPTERHYQINHKDGNSLNNHIDNLEWATRSNNQRHAVETGLKGRGDKLYNASLKDNQVHRVCEMLSQGRRVKEVAEEVGAKPDIIRKIKAGDMYFHIRNKYEITHGYKTNFSEETVRWVCGKILEGYGDREIASLSTNKNLVIIQIKRIRNKIRYKEISNEYF